MNYISLCGLAVGARGGLSSKSVGPFVGIVPAHLTPNFMSLCPNLRLSGICIFLSHFSVSSVTNNQGIVHTLEKLLFRLAPTETSHYNLENSRVWNTVFGKRRVTVCVHLCVCVSVCLHTHTCIKCMQLLSGLGIKRHSVWESVSEPQKHSNYQGLFHQGSRARQVSAEQKKGASTIVRNAPPINGCKGMFFPYLGLRANRD